MVVLVASLFFVESHGLVMCRPADGSLGGSRLGALPRSAALGVLGPVLSGTCMRLSWLHPGVALPRHRWMYFGVGAAGQGLS